MKKSSNSQVSLPSKSRTSRSLQEIKADHDSKLSKLGEVTYRIALADAERRDLLQALVRLNQEYAGAAEVAHEAEYFKKKKS